MFRKFLRYGSKCADDYWYDGGLLFPVSLDFNFQMLLCLDLSLLLLASPERLLESAHLWWTSAPFQNNRMTGAKVPKTQGSAPSIPRMCFARCCVKLYKALVQQIHNTLIFVDWSRVYRCCGCFLTVSRLTSVYTSTTSCWHRAVHSATPVLVRGVSPPVRFIRRYRQFLLGW